MPRPTPAKGERTKQLSELVANMYSKILGLVLGIRCLALTITSMVIFLLVVL